MGKYSFRCGEKSSGGTFWAGVGVHSVGIWRQNVAQKSPTEGGALFTHVWGPSPHGMDPKTGPKSAPEYFYLQRLY